jgi:hypothetical protein
VTLKCWYDGSSDCDCRAYWTLKVTYVDRIWDYVFCDNHAATEVVSWDQPPRYQVIDFYLIHQ